MALERAGSDDDLAPESDDCPHCGELVAEILVLRAQVRELQAAKDELARAALDRDYERPPHYL